MNACSLCSPALGPEIAESEYWRLILNNNQNLLGKCFWVLRRHVETITLLKPEEWSDLHRQIIRATQALVLFAKPDHFNYVFLQNQDRHVHMHLMPRYAGPRTFAGLNFNDPDYPGHYGVTDPARHLTKEQDAMLAEELRKAFVKAAGAGFMAT